MSLTAEFLSLLKERMHPGGTIAAYQEVGIIAIDKAPNLLTHPNPKSPAKKESISELAQRRGIAKKAPSAPAGRQFACWLDAPYDFNGEYFTVGDRRLYLCNRLDSATSGIFIICADEELAHQIKARWAGGEVTKIYLAVLRGNPSRGFEKWNDSMEKQRVPNERGVRMRGLMGGGLKRQGLLAKTVMRRIHYRPTDLKLSLVALVPLTGRTHQLRVQSQIHKVPILGDAKYGDFRLNRIVGERFKEARGRLFLHSHVTQFEYEWGGRKYQFTVDSPVPDSFWAVMKSDLGKAVEKMTRSILAE